MEYQTIIVERKNSIGVITLNRPDKLNSITLPMAKGLNSALLEMGADDEVNVIIIRGEGRAFCAGLDLSELGKMTNLDYYNLFPTVEQFAMTIPKISKPVIGQVHSFALAGGSELALACDLVVASDDAVFGTTAINVGGFCFTPSVLLLRHVGRKKALEMVLTGDRVSAEEALRLGLVNKVVPREELEKATWDLAEKIAGKSPLAVRMGKQAFYNMADMELEKAVQYVQAVNVTLSGTEDAQEGFAAFVEKRTPKWEKR